MLPQSGSYTLPQEPMVRGSLWGRLFKVEFELSGKELGHTEMRAWEEMNVRHNGHGRLWANPICFTESTGPIKRHISLVSYAFYDQLLYPGPLRGTWCRKSHRQGGHSDWSLCLLTNPVAFINISWGIFISPHTPWGSLDIRNNAAKRMLRLLNAGAKINFYEPSCSTNTVWHLNFVSESTGGGSLTLHSRGLCCPVLCAPLVAKMDLSMALNQEERLCQPARKPKESCILDKLYVSLGEFYFPLFYNLSKYYMHTFLENYQSWAFITMFILPCNSRGKQLFSLLNTKYDTQGSFIHLVVHCWTYSHTYIMVTFHVEDY